MSNQPLASSGSSEMEAITFTRPRNGFLVAALSIGGLALVLLLLGILLSLQSGTGLYFLGGLLLSGLFGCCAVITLVGYFKPPRLQIDAQGLTMSALGHHYRILWSQVEQIQIIRFSSLMGSRPVGRPFTRFRVPVDAMPVDQDSFGLVAWLHPGVPRPKEQRTYLPRWIDEIGGVQVCDLGDLYAPATEVGNAVARFAGKRWNDAREPQ
jgi:hypothetical protein